MQPNVQAVPKPLRCSVYCRKSTEEGLEQDFNSLDAQRESGEAYVRSQRQQGWVLVSDRYDDGGFTGANMERPALQKLLRDIDAGKIDCVVVYKVDRLSRSLLDFARIMEVFEKRNVSFVSVTQQLNTTSPMGRLTLNVLLSFAQFERDLISERTRDKMSAARRKGKWTGGFVPLGYDIDAGSHRLVTNTAEAEQVRDIFRMFLESRSLGDTLRELSKRGRRTKSFTTLKGKHHTGSEFNRPALMQVLRNVLYVGEVRHRGEIYPGEQPAIVDRPIWTKVQEILDENLRGPDTRIRQRRPVTLEKLRCAVCGSPMLQGYTTKRGKRYRYYQCQKARKQGAQTCPGQIISARRIEHAVVEGLRELSVAELTPSDRIETLEYNHRSEQVAVKLRSTDGAVEEMVIPLPKQLFERRCVSPGEGSDLPTIPRIARMMAMAMRFEEMLAAGTAKTYRHLARRMRVSTSRITQVLKLAKLAPAIQERVLWLERPVPGIAEPALRKIANELSWQKQVEMFEALLA